MRRRMVWKLAACFAAVLLLFAAVLGGVYAAAFRRHTISVNREAMEVHAASIAETLTSFGSGMGRGRGGGYGAYLRFLNELTPAEVWIVDGDRTLLAPGRDSMSGWSGTVSPLEPGRLWNGPSPGRTPGGRAFPPCWTPRP